MYYMARFSHFQVGVILGPLGSPLTLAISFAEAPLAEVRFLKYFAFFRSTSIFKMLALHIGMNLETGLVIYVLD